MIHGYARVSNQRSGPQHSTRGVTAVRRRRDPPGKAIGDDKRGQGSSRRTAEFKQWAANCEPATDHRTREDIEAEMLKRGREPPFDLVQDEMKIITAASRERSDLLLGDPERLVKTEQRLSDRIEQFQQSIAPKKVN
jgi:hypothetical protein